MAIKTDRRTCLRLRVGQTPKIMFRAFRKGIT